MDSGFYYEIDILLYARNWYLFVFENLSSTLELG